MKCYFTFLFLLIVLTIKAQNNQSALLPMPNHIEQKNGKPLRLATSKISIAPHDAELQFAATSLQALLKEQMQLDVPLHASSRTAAIHLRIDPSMAGAEHYTIRVDEKGLDICGATPAACLTDQGIPFECLQQADFIRFIAVLIDCAIASKENALVCQAGCLGNDTFSVI